MVVGYTPYLQSIADLTAGKELIASGMRQEVPRCQAALQRARDGCIVTLISSGDAGVYGMAGLAIELAAAQASDVEIEIVPGVTAALAAGAALGAPLMLDFAVVSLSDLLVPWDTIRRRLAALRSALCRLVPPPPSDHADPLRQTVAHLRLAFPSPECPVSAFQLRFQQALMG